MVNDIVPTTNVLNGDYQLFEGTFTPPTSGVYVIGIRGRSTGSNNPLSIDDISFIETPSCLPPSNLSISNITPVTAQISWNPATPIPDEGYEWAVTSSVNPPASGTPTSETSLVATGLTPNAAQYLHVRSNCGDGDFSAWTTSTVFNTPCGYPIPFFEGFESGFTHNTAVAGCISQQSLIGTQVWTANSSLTTYNRTPRTGSFNAFLRFDNDDWMFIPVLLEEGVNYTGALYARQDEPDPTQASITMSFGTAANAAAMTGTIIPQTPVINGDYQLLEGYFTAPATGAYFIGIRGVIAPSVPPWFLSIDDISIIETPTCLPPTNLSNSSLSLSTATHTWTPAVLNPTADYEWAVTTSATPPANGTATSATSASSTGLAPNTTHYLHVRSNCGAGDFSAWSTLEFFTGPCTATGTSNSTHITNITLEGITTLNNSSGANAGYADFTSVEPTVSQIPGGAINFGFTATSSAGRAIFVDWNNDLQFDPSEMVFASNGYASGTSTGTFNVPANQPFGSYLVRAVVDWNEFVPSACPVNINGETEDYLLIVTTDVTTQLQTGSCGATNVAPQQMLVATNVGAPQYRFRFTGPNNGGPGWNNDQFIVDRHVRYVWFNWLVPGFQLGATYSIDVAVGDGNGNFGPYGTACDVTLEDNIPLTQVQTSQCSATVDGNTNIIANNIFNAQGYRFRITGPNNGGPGWDNDVFILDRIQRYFKFNWTVPGATPGGTFSVEVAYLLSDGVTYSPYGAACNITLSPQTTQIQASQCGIIGLMPNTNVVANLVYDAQGYRFRITGSNNGGPGWNNDVFILDRIPQRQFTFQAHVPGVLPGETYEIEVAFLQNDGVTYSAFGTMCEVTLFGVSELILDDSEIEMFVDNKITTVVEFGANASQNPFTTDFGLQVLNANATETINVTVYDMSGKLIERNAINPMDIETVRFGANLAAGMYMIEVRQGVNQAVVRQVKN